MIFSFLDPILQRRDQGMAYNYPFLTVEIDIGQVLGIRIKIPTFIEKPLNWAIVCSKGCPVVSNPETKGRSLRDLI